MLEENYMEKLQENIETPPANIEADQENVEVQPEKVEDSSAHILSAREEYCAPIPHPSIMKKYGEISPSYPERIFLDFERNSEFARQQEHDELHAKIADVKRSQWMAFVIAVLLLGIIALSLYLGRELFANVSGLAFFVFIIRSFLDYVKKKKKQK